ncbi:hypothetical protein BDW59DRAFT_167522 [Aspergillus cavernicola]|uniref:Uncharacterized protein n=1 Tax=Aspergillus cavernicola TaxID=176166 RepID=A0ABR4HDA8_9EURO
MSTERRGFFLVDEKGSPVEYTDLAFVTSRPPDVPSRNRIVAVCGIYDCDKEGNMASPQEDGAHWEDLKTIPPSASQDPAATGAPSGRRLASLHREFELRAREYMEAKPGRDSAASNVAIGNTIRRCFQDGQYIKAMGIQFSSCLTYSMEEDNHPEPEMNKKVDRAFGLLARSHLIADFFTPEFYKPVKVLAIALAKSCGTEEEMRKQLAVALKFKMERDKLVLPCVGASQIMEDAEIQEHAHSFAAAVRALGHKIRVKEHSMTPSHKRYQPVPSSA